MSVEVLDPSEFQTPMQIASRVLEMSHSELPRSRKMSLLMGYANHPHDKVRASALDSLAAIISPELRSFYIPFLSDLSVEVRANAISYLACDPTTAEAYSDEILNSINGLLQSDNETAHEILLQCLVTLNKPDYAYQLAELSKIANYKIQLEALRLLKTWATQSPELSILASSTEKFLQETESNSTCKPQTRILVKNDEIFLEPQQFLKDLKAALKQSNRISKKVLLTQIRNYEVLLDESELFEILGPELINEKDVDCLSLMIDITKQLSNIDHWEVLRPFLCNDNNKIVSICVEVLSERNDLRILPMLMEAINEEPLYASKINIIINGIHILKKKRPDIAVLAVEKIITANIDNSIPIVDKILRDWITPPAELSSVLIRSYLNKPNQKLHDTINSYLDSNSTPWDLVLIDNLIHLARDSETKNILDKIKEKLVKKYKSLDNTNQKRNYKNHATKHQMSKVELFLILATQTIIAVFTYLLVNYFVIG